MQLTETKREKSLLVTLNGRLDSATSTSFETQLTGLVAAGQRTVVLDCTELSYLSSAGLRALLVAAKKMKAAEGRLVVAALKDEVREVFELSGFNTVFPIYESVAEAEASLT